MQQRSKKQDLWDEVLPLVEKKEPENQTPAAPVVRSKNDSKSIHDEIKEKLVAIGELLGFESRSEVKIATGAVVDAVWEAKIGNMGKAIDRQPDTQFEESSKQCCCAGSSCRRR